MFDCYSTETVKSTTRIGNFDKADTNSIPHGLQCNIDRIWGRSSVDFLEGGRINIKCVDLRSLYFSGSVPFASIFSGLGRLKGPIEQVTLKELYQLVQRDLNFMEALKAYQTMSVAYGVRITELAYNPTKFNPQENNLILLPKKKNTVYVRFKLLQNLKSVWVPFPKVEAFIKKLNKYRAPEVLIAEALHKIWPVSDSSSSYSWHLGVRSVVGNGLELDLYTSDLCDFDVAVEYQGHCSHYLEPEKIKNDLLKRSLFSGALVVVDKLSHFTIDNAVYCILKGVSCLDDPYYQAKLLSLSKVSYCSSASV